MMAFAFDLKSLRLPGARNKRKPSDIVYSASDRPPTGPLLVLAEQHAVMAIALSAYALAAAKLAGLSVSDTRIFLSCTILGVAITTFLQAWGGRTGAGALMVHIPDPVIVPFVALILREDGLGGMITLGLSIGLPAIGLSRIIPHLRMLFPPAVLGVVVSMAGFSLIQGASQQAFGLGQNYVIDPLSALMTLTTLGVIVAFSIWGTGKMKLFSLAAGIIAGVAVAAFCGRLTGFEMFEKIPILALPTVPAPVLAIEPGLLVAIIAIALLGQFDTFANTVIIDRMDDADWHRSDMKMAGGGILGSGLGDILSGLVGGMPTGASSANIGLSHATRSTSRWIGLAAALVIALVAFLPQVTLALTLIPTPVIGAIQVYAATFLIVSGLELAASRATDSRGIFIIGISIFVGLAVMLMPQLADGAPASFRHFIGSGFAMSGLVAVLLNLMFLLGTSIDARRPLDKEADISSAILEFIEIQGGKWAARRSVVSRAAQAAMEAAELIANSGKHRRPTAIRARFDEFNFDVEIQHTGSVIIFSEMQMPDASHLLEATNAHIDRTLAAMSMALVQRFADTVRTGERDGGAFIALHFDH